MKRLAILILTMILMFSFVILVTADILPGESIDMHMNHSIIKEKDNFCDITVITPHLEGFAEAYELNRHIRNKVIDAIGEIRTVGMELEEFNKTTELNISYDYSLAGDFISMRFTTYTYLGGAHGSTVIESMTANLKED